MLDEPSINLVSSPAPSWRDLSGPCPRLWLTATIFFADPCILRYQFDQRPLKTETGRGLLADCGPGDRCNQRLRMLRDDRRAGSQTVRKNSLDRDKSRGGVMRKLARDLRDLIGVAFVAGF